MRAWPASSDPFGGRRRAVRRAAETKGALYALVSSAFCSS
ncbi:hypothetical protein BTL_3323 [Burkholderia thailandensis H0587]|nr:hypothetical protein BTL_3323 [Burkholderia thailandensis H0587]